MVRRTGWRTTTAVALLVAAALVFVMAASVAAQSDKPVTPGAPIEIVGPVPAGFASWAEVMVMQEQLVAAADRILAATAVGDGLGALVAAPEERRLRGYWKGPVPAAVARVMEDVQGSVPVQVHPARYSAQELRDEAQRLVETPGEGGIEILVAGSLPDARGLRVSVTGSVEAARQLPAVRDAAVHVELELGEVPQDLYNRQLDAASFWGGARWHIDGVFGNLYTGCTTAFAVSYLQQPALLTAAHCIDPFYYGHNPGGKAGLPGLPGDSGNAQEPSMGFAWTSQAFLEQDAALLVGALYTGRIYQGPWDTSTSSRVLGAQSNYIGNYVCISGASSATVCNIVVTDVDQYLSPIWEDSSISRGPFVLASQLIPLKSAAAKGDSGGPVFAVGPSTGQAYPDVYARGLISAGTNLLAPSESYGEGTECYHNLYYGDIKQILAHYNAKLMVFP